MKATLVLPLLTAWCAPLAAQVGPQSSVRSVPSTGTDPRTLAFVETGQLLPQKADLVPDVVSGDFDGDGESELVIVSYDGAPRYLDRDAFGRFLEPDGRLPSKELRATAVDAGDVDGDGDLDLVIGTAIVSRASHAFLGGHELLLLNDGSGHFQTPPFSVGGPGIVSFQDETKDVALADIDGDGDLDLVVANGTFIYNYPTSAQNVAYRNDGNGRFTADASLLPSDQDDTTSLVLGDLNGDGALDLVLGNATFAALGIDGFTRVLLGDGTGRMVPSQDLGSASDEIRGVVLGDLEGDGDLDLVAGSKSGQNRAFTNDGVGGFVETTASTLPVASDATLSLFFGDLDGDGAPDLVTGNEFGTANVLHKNVAGTLVAVPGALFDSSSTEAIAAEDFDRDGDVDLFLANFSGYDLLLLGDGVGGFRDVTQSQESAVRLDSTVDLGDWNGDGLLDVALFGGRPRLLGNDGAGIFEDQTPPNIAVPSGFSAGALDDLDGDGDLDLVVAGNASAQLYAGDGTGGFSDVSSRLPAVLATSSARSVFTGDVNGDGLSDIYVGTSSTQGDVLLFQGAGGVFTDESARLPANTMSTLEVAFGDVNGDGRTDLWIVAGDFFTQVNQDRLFLQNAAGTFDDGGAGLPASPGISMGLATGDVDGDGDIDAWVTTGTPSVFGAQRGPVRLLLNDGGGVFTESQAHPMDNALGRVRLHDLEGDGDLDAIVGSFYPGFETKVYLNRGDGSFLTARPTPWSGPSQFDFAFADLDGDGDSDVFEVGTGTNHVRRNVAVELARSSLPRLGGHLVLDLWGPVHAPFVLGSSLSSASIPTAAGVLRLDPAALSIVRRGVLDGAGQRQIQLAIPTRTTLLGTRVHWQALVGRRLSAREDSVILDY